MPRLAVASDYRAVSPPVHGDGESCRRLHVAAEQFVVYSGAMIAYTVACTFNDPTIAEEWIAWLRDEHLAEVIAAGALDAEIIQCDPERENEAVRCEVRYHFPSREAFAVYEKDHAPRLRAAGLKRFPPERGLVYHRTLGEVCAHLESPTAHGKG